MDPKIDSAGEKKDQKSDLFIEQDVAEREEAASRD